MKHAALIRDESLCDAELSLAVANLNAVKNSRSPKFAYVGIPWAGNVQVTDQIVANVEEAFTEYVKAAIARNEYSPVSLPPCLLFRPVLQSWTCSSGHSLLRTTSCIGSGRPSRRQCACVVACVVAQVAGGQHRKDSIAISLASPQTSSAWGNASCA